MKTFQENTIKKNFSAALLVILLLLGSLASAYFIATQDMRTGAAIVVGIAGLGLGILSLVNPYFGFYFSIFVGFILFLIQRTFIFNGFGFVVEILEYVTFLGILITRYIKKDASFITTGAWHPVSVLMCVYLLYTIFESLNPATHSMEGNLVYIREVAKQVVSYFIAVNLFRNIKDIKWFLVIWSVMMLLCAMYGCWQQWHGLTHNEMAWVSSSDTYIRLYRLDNGDFRKFSTLTDPMSFGVLSAVSALIALPVMLLSKDIKLKVVLLPSIMIMLLGMSYSSTRTATFAFVIGVVLYILMNLHNRNTLIFAAVSVVLFGVLMFGPFYGNVTINRFRSTFNRDDASFDARNNNRKVVQPYIHSHPFGGGLSTTGTMGATYNPHHPIAAFPPDSGLLKFALELGWIGLILLCSIYFVIIRNGIKVYFKTRDPMIKKYSLVLVLATFSFVVCQYSQVAIGQIPGVFLFYGLAAGITRLHQQHKLDIIKQQPAN